MEQPVVDHRVALAGVDAHAVEAGGQPGAAQIQAEEVGRQHDHRLALRDQAGQDLLALHAHDPAHARLRRKPGQAALDQAAPGQGEVFPGQGAAFGFGQIGKAQAQIGVHHPAAGQDDPVKQQAEASADGCLDGQGQPVQQPQQGNDESTH